MSTGDDNLFHYAKSIRMIKVDQDLKTRGDCVAKVAELGAPGGLIKRDAACRTILETESV